MKNWLELEQRFRTLEASLRHCRLDGQWGAAGEYWRLSGVAPQMAMQEYELLSGVAGRLLEKVYSSEVREEQALLNIEDAKVRWYNLLKQRSPAFGNHGYGQQLHEDGSSAGFIFTGSLDSIAAAAANQCLSLQATHPIVEKKSTWQLLHENYIKAVVVGIIVVLVGTAAKVFFE